MTVKQIGKLPKTVWSPYHPPHNCFLMPEVLPPAVCDYGGGHEVLDVVTDSTDVNGRPMRRHSKLPAYSFGPMVHEVELFYIFAGPPVRQSAVSSIVTKVLFLIFFWLLRS